MKLDIDIVGRFAQFQDSLDQISRSTAKFAKDTSASTQLLRSSFEGLAAGLTVGAFTAAIKSAIDLGDRFNDLGVRTGLTAQQLLVLKGAADRSGSSIEGLDTLAAKLPKVMKEAGESGSYASRAIAALGVDPKKGLTDLYGYLQDVGKGLSKLNDGAGKSAYAIAALGKGGDQLIGVVQSLAETEERMKRLGITMSEDFKSKADKFNDSLTDISELSQNAARQIAVGLLPAIQKVVEAFIEFKRQGGDFEAIGRGIGSAIIQIADAALTTTYEINSIVHAFRNLRELVALPFSSESYSQLTKRMEAEAEKIKKSYLEARAVLYAPPDQAESGSTTGGKDAKPPISDGQIATAKAAADAKRQLDDTLSKIQLDAVKANGANELRVLEDFHKDALIGDQDYWQKRNAIAEAAFKAETDVLSQQIARQTSIRDKARKESPGSADELKAEKALQETIAKRIALEGVEATRVITDNQAKARSADEYRLTIRAIATQIEELQGNTTEVAARKFADQTQNLRRQLEANSDKTALASLDKLQQLTNAQAGYNAEQTKGSLLEQQLAAEELRLRTSQEVGALTEYEAMRRTGEARARIVPQLQAIAEAQAAIAKASGNPKLIADADTFAAKVDQIAKQVDVVGLKISGVFVDNFAQAFTDFATGAKSASDAFKSFAQSVLTELIRLEAKSIATSLFGKSGSGGGFLSSLFGGGKSSAVSESDSWINYAAGIGAEKAAPSFALNGATKSAPAITITNHYAVDAAADRAVVANMIAAGGEANKKSILESMRRGGVFAR